MDGHPPPIKLSYIRASSSVKKNSHPLHKEGFAIPSQRFQTHYGREDRTTGSGGTCDEDGYREIFIISFGLLKICFYLFIYFGFILLKSDEEIFMWIG
ncbi:hypothetical protein CEXT_719081 [Caerostris extrusa]|uniref:Uncharacterized protein n=1 Tax=Caerostris extrusa TaxID=172846 RepID=A0AAV4U465_CAEEX|nr:hypothetical protein CEXT_719081 [Caerostris extrusa]